MSHNRVDSTFSVTTALPAQNTSTSRSTAFDLGVANQSLIGANSELVVSIPATTCATGQTITITVQDSADNSSFAAVPTLATLVLTGSSNATAAATRTYRLPSDIRRYVTINRATSSTTGDLTAISTTMQLQF
jgi:hypothetical protein